jgi:hypothetical protein
MDECGVPFEVEPTASAVVWWPSGMTVGERRDSLANRERADGEV